MVHLEHPDPRGQPGPEREAVQPRAQDHVLPGAAPHGFGQAVLGVPAAAGDLRPGPGQHRVRAVRPVEPDELPGPLAEHGPGQRVREDNRFVVDDQMGGPRRRRGKRGKARLPLVDHARQIIATIRL